MNLFDLLTFAVERNASDLHLSSGLSPMLRIDGEIKKIHVDALNNAQVHKMLIDILTDEQKQLFEKNNDLDFSYEIDNVARFRVNAFQQLRGTSVAFRVIPSSVTNLESIGAPEIFKNLIDKPNGLILITGPTGSGKSTTLAAMLDLINEKRKAHILTIEDPIEFIHTPKNCIINQRALKEHTKSFDAALRSALREDPDIILVGEMRDPETISLALTAAETGHLVLSTLHTNSASKAIDRIIDSFEASDKAMIRAMLAESMQAIIAQILLPKRNGGRIAAWEILIGNHAVRNLIRENKIPQLYSTIQTSRNLGMQTMDDSLHDLVKQKIIHPDIARPMLRNVDKLDRLLN